jgi:hypothetical protein
MGWLFDERLIFKHIISENQPPTEGPRAATNRIAKRIRNTLSSWTWQAFNDDPD